MKTKTIDCVECGEKVSYGRLSCPACGALLASVAGGPARPVLEWPRPTRMPAIRPRRGGRGRSHARRSRSRPTRSRCRSMTAADAIAPGRRGRRAPCCRSGRGARGERPTPLPKPSRRRSGEHELEPAAFSLSPEPTEALPAAVRTPFDGPEPILIARPYVHRKDVAAATGPGHTPPSAYRPPVLALSAAAAAGAVGRERVLAVPDHDRRAAVIDRRGRGRCRERGRRRGRRATSSPGSPRSARGS